MYFGMTALVCTPAVYDKLKIKKGLFVHGVLMSHRGGIEL
jgi:hypothetical protein